MSLSKITATIFDVLDEWRKMEPGLSTAKVNEGRCSDFAWAVFHRFGGSIYSTPAASRLPYHVWIVHDGRCYDSEAPTGVDEWTDLPIFRRAKCPNCGDSHWMCDCYD